MSERWATFDCYGTLIDWEGGIAQTLTELWPDADHRELLARYHDIEPRIQQGSAVPYRDVLTRALRDLARAAGLPLDEEDATALVSSLPHWPPFPETAQALRELRVRGWRTAILSNTDPELLDASIRNIGVDIDLRITVADSRTYKPDPGHWRRFFEVSGADTSRHVHVAASLFHDITPAAALGLKTVWINRAGEQSDVVRTAELPDLRMLPDVLDGVVAA